MNKSDIVGLVNNPDYESIIYDVARKFAINVIDDISPPSIQRDESKLKYIDVLPRDLLGMIIANKREFIQFVVDKLQKFSGLTFKSEQRFSLVDQSGDDADGDEKIIGYPKNFLIMHMVEFFILTNKPGILNDYLKFVRITNAKKYAADLKKIYVSVI